MAEETSKGPATRGPDLGDINAAASTRGSNMGEPSRGASHRVTMKGETAGDDGGGKYGGGDADGNAVVDAAGGTTCAMIRLRGNSGGVPGVPAQTCAVLASTMRLLGGAFS